MADVWVWVGSGTVVALVVWLVRLSWLLRGVHDVALSAKEHVRDCVTKSVCDLKDSGTKNMLGRIEKGVTAIWARLDALQIGERLTKIETELEALKKRRNGNGK